MSSSAYESSFETLVQKVWCSSHAQGARSSAGADGPLLLCPQALKLLGLFPSSCFSVGRLPSFGADPPAQHHNPSCSEGGNLALKVFS